MRNLLLTVAALVAVISCHPASAKDVCFKYDNGNPEALMLYKIKVVKVHKDQGERLTGVAVMPNNPQLSPLMVEGTALGLTHGHINYYLRAYKQDGYPAADPVSVVRANQPSYSGVRSANLYAIQCDGFPILEVYYDSPWD